MSDCVFWHKSPKGFVIVCYLSLLAWDTRMILDGLEVIYSFKKNFFIWGSSHDSSLILDCISYSEAAPLWFWLYAFVIVPFKSTHLVWVSTSGLSSRICPFELNLSFPHCMRLPPHFTVGIVLVLPNKVLCSTAEKFSDGLITPQNILPCALSPPLMSSMSAFLLAPLLCGPDL